MQEIWVQSLDLEDPLEKGMAIDSSILVPQIPGTEEPGGLKSMGSQRVWHDWATEHEQHYIWESHFYLLENKALILDT